MRVPQALRRRLAAEGGYSLIELVTVMSILAFVMSGLTALMAQGSNAEVDMNSRFQAQTSARLAIDKLRREIHCASAATASGTPASNGLYPTLTLTLPSGCATGTGTVVWCTSVAGTNRYKLYRYTSGSCTGGVRWADYLTTGGVFSAAAASSSYLASVHVDVSLNPKPRKSQENYELCDNIFLRNTTRSGSGSAPVPC